MKKLFLLLFVAMTFAACEKDADVNPKPTAALSDKFVGSYKLSSLRYTDAQTNLDLPTLPLTNNGKTISGTVTLTKVTDTKATMNILLKTTGVDDYEQVIKELDVRQVGSEYGLFLGTARIADVDGSVIIFNYSETDPSTKETIAMAFVAKR